MCVILQLILQCVYYFAFRSHSALAFVVSGNRVITCMIKYVAMAQLRHSIIRCDTLAESGLHADPGEEDLSPTSSRFP